MPYTCHTLAPSLARSQSKRPLRNLILEPCFPIPGHLERRKRPIRDQCSTLRSRIRWRRTSRETPENSWPTMTSGSALCSVTWEVNQSTAECQTPYVLNRLLRSIRSFFIGDMKPFPLAFAFTSKLGGKRSSGRTNVCTAHGRLSGGVGSSIITAMFNIE